MNDNYLAGYSMEYLLMRENEIDMMLDVYYELEKEMDNNDRNDKGSSTIVE